MQILGGEKKKKMIEEKGIDWSAPPHPPTHDFDLESVVEGDVLSFGKVPGLTDDNGREYTGVYVQIKTKTGIETVWISTVIRSKLDSLAVRVGDHLGIKRLGDIKAKKSEYTYSDFDVRCIHADGQEEE